MFALPPKGGSTLNPIALRKAKIVYNFGLYRVKGMNLLLWGQAFSFKN